MAIDHPHPLPPGTRFEESRLNAAMGATRVGQNSLVRRLERESSGNRRSSQSKPGLYCRLRLYHGILPASVPAAGRGAGIALTPE